MKRKWSIQAMSFRPNPFHANYIMNVYNMSYMYSNKILYKPNSERVSCRGMELGMSNLLRVFVVCVCVGGGGGGGRVEGW